MMSTRKLQATVAMGAVALYAFGGNHPVGAQEPAPKASAFAVTADILGTNVIPPTPESTTEGVKEGENDATLIGIPGDPVIVNGTLIARSAVHATNDLPSTLNQVDQPKPSSDGKYSARAVGQIEDARVLINGGIPGGQLLHAGLIRAEAVVSCVAGTPTYSANSEVVDLQIADQDPFSGPLNDALKQITDGIAPLADLIKVDLNVVNADKSVDAIVITLLKAAGDNGAPGPLAKITLGHAEVSGNPCGGPLPSTHTPQCSDGVDNDGDALIDKADPGCHTDGDAQNDASYDANDDDETNATPVVLGNAALPKTGAAIPTGIAAGLGVGALSLLALRRRLSAV